jgi:hypothetical protein
MAAKAKQTGAIAKEARSFYNWSTLGTFAGTATAVNVIWVTCKSLGFGWAESYIVPLVASLVIMAVYGVLSEPEEKTTWWQKSQKIVQGLINGLLIYSAVIGIKVVIS